MKSLTFLYDSASAYDKWLSYSAQCKEYRFSELWLQVTALVPEAVRAIRTSWSMDCSAASTAAQPAMRSSNHHAETDASLCALDSSVSNASGVTQDEIEPRGVPSIVKSTAQDLIEVAASMSNQASIPAPTGSGPSVPPLEQQPAAPLRRGSNAALRAQFHLASSSTSSPSFFELKDFGRNQEKEFGREQKGRPGSR